MAKIALHTMQCEKYKNILKRLLQLRYDKTDVISQNFANDGKISADTICNVSQSGSIFSHILHLLSH